MAKIFSVTPAELDTLKDRNVHSHVGGPSSTSSDTSSYPTSLTDLHPDPFSPQFRPYKNSSFSSSSTSNFSKIVLSFFLSPAGYRFLRYNRSKKSKASAAPSSSSSSSSSSKRRTREVSVQHAATLSHKSLQSLRTSLVDPEEYEQWFKSQSRSSSSQEPNHHHHHTNNNNITIDDGGNLPPLLSTHPNAISSATRAGIRGFILAYIAGTAMDVLLPAMLKQKFRGLFHKILTHPSSLALGVSCGLYAFLYKLAFHLVALALERVSSSRDNKEQEQHASTSRRSDSGIALGNQAGMGRRRGRGTAAVGSEGIVFERMTQIDSGDDQNQHHHADHDDEDEDTMYISPKEMAARNRKKWIPAMVAALLASPAYALVPGQARRLTMALYFLTYAGESAYAALEHEGLLKWVPSWVGVWILAPISTSQIVHTFIHHTDCTPLAWKKLIMSQCDPFLHRPKSFDTKALGPFPLAEQLFEGMGNYLQAGYRAQPILASAASVATASAAALASDGSSGARRFLLPEACESVIKFTEGMGHHSAGCAIFHPQDPSCRGAMKTLVRRNAVFSFKMYAVLAALTFVARGGNVFNKGVLNYFTKTTLSILRSTVATWGIVVTAFPMYCGMDRLAFLPDSFLTTKRHYLNGFLGGLWVLLETPARQSALTLYFTRFMIESIWRRAVKAGWAKSFRGGETMLFGVAMALVMGVFETTPGLARRTVIQSALSKVFTD